MSTTQEKAGTRRALIVAAFLLAILLAAALAYRLSSPWNPEYQGKTANVWIRELNLDQGPLTPAAQAIEHFGSNATPMLVAMLRARDSSLKLRLLQLLAKQPVINLKNRFPPAAVSQQAAVNACCLLGPKVSGAAPALGELVNESRGGPAFAGAWNPGSPIGHYALNTLAAMGPGGIHQLVGMLTDRHASFQVRAAELLGTAPGSGTEEVTAALSGCTNASDPTLAGAATKALDLIQRRLEQSLPALATNWTGAPEGSSQTPETVWNASQGTRILSTSGLYPGFQAEDVFGTRLSNPGNGETGDAIFNDNLPDGFVHFIEWENPGPVTLRSIGLIGGHDGANASFQRAFRSFKLYARNGETEPFKLIYAEDVTVPYGQGWYVSMVLLLRNLDAPVTARQFRADFVQNAAGLWHGPRVLRLYGFNQPLNAPMVKAALENLAQPVREQAQAVLEEELQKQK